MHDDDGAEKKEDGRDHREEANDAHFGEHIRRQDEYDRDRRAYNHRYVLSRPVLQYLLQIVRYKQY